MKIAVVVAVAVVLGISPAFGKGREGHEGMEAHEAAKVAPGLAARLKEAKVSLAAGLRAAEKLGTPLSAKFEVEDGKLQLSVYVVSRGKFLEAVVDHQSGAVAKSTPITGGEDLVAAKGQAAAVSRARRALRDLVAGVERSNPGFVAVAVTPELEDGLAEAEVTLVKGTESKLVEVRL